MSQPISIAADGSLKVVWVPTISDTENPTVAELTAGSVVDLSCYLTAGGFTPNTDEQVITDDRLCSRQVFERVGRYTDTLEVMYVHNPDSAGNNLAYTTLAYLTTGYIVTRWGVDYEDAFTTGDIVDVIPAQAGIQRKSPPEANSVLKVAQKIFVTGAVQRDVTVV